MFDLWEKGNEDLFKDIQNSRDMITQVLNQKTKRTLKYFNFNLVFYWLVQMVNIILISMNIMGYKSNENMLWVLGAQLVLTLGVAFYGIFIFIKHRDIHIYSENLRVMIDKHLDFFRTHYEVWLLLISLTVLFLIFNINIMVDNMDGQYYINRVGLYVGINIGVFLFIYATQKIASQWSYQLLKANLNDLKAGMLDKSVALEKRGRKLRWIWIVIAVLFTILFVLGLMKALMY